MTASPFTAVSPLCHRGEFQHGESPFTAVTPPKRKTSPVITGQLITGYHRGDGDVVFSSSRFSITVRLLPANVYFKGAVLELQLLAWLIN